LAIIPPYLTGDRTAQGINDFSSKFMVTNAKGMPSIKGQFHRLYPRAEGNQFYCSIILALDISPASLMDAIAVQLRDNRMGLWRRSIDAEQVSKIQLRDDRMGLWRRSIDAEQVSKIGWLL
jgi:hypothetical protein